MERIQPASERNYAPAAQMPPPARPQVRQLTPDTALAPLHFRLLQTAAQRRAIAPLRKLAAFGVERDLSLGLEALEQVRDDHALVVAVYQGVRPIATLRFVPAGRRALGPTAGIRPLYPGPWKLGGRPSDHEPGGSPPGSPAAMSCAHPQGTDGAAGGPPFPRHDDPGDGAPVAPRRNAHGGQHRGSERREILSRPRSGRGGRAGFAGLHTGSCN